MASKGPQRQPGATDTGPRPGRFPLGSAKSRAAARAMLVAQKASEAEEDWDKEEFDTIGVAEILTAVQQRMERGEEPKPDWSPLPIPPGKEDTVRGRLRARINDAHARMARHEAELKAKR